jgi:hypothetical protein
MRYRFIPQQEIPMITGALPYLAGLVPEHDVRLLDKMSRRFIRLGHYDIVGVNG